MTSTTGIAGQHAALHGLADALLDGRDVLLRDRAADDLVVELEALARRLRLDARCYDVAVLAVAAGLADELALALDGLA